jgi:hypothetical protein
MSSRTMSSRTMLRLTVFWLTVFGPMARLRQPCVADLVVVSVMTSLSEDALVISFAKFG